MWLFYALIRLLQLQDLAILVHRSETYLFISGQAYRIIDNKDCDMLLRRHKTQRPIMALIDGDSESPSTESLGIALHLFVFPVHASSSNLGKYGWWAKRRAATIIGLPLWDVGELWAGYVSPMMSRL